MEFPEAPALPLPFRFVFPDVREETELDWMAEAACTSTDPDAFFPDRGESNRAAKKVCAGCDVRARCLAWALEHDEHFGVFGGLSVHEREELRRSVA